MLCSDNGLLAKADDKGSRPVWCEQCGFESAAVLFWFKRGNEEGGSALAVQGQCKRIT